MGLRRFVGTVNAINWLRYAIGLIVFGALASTVVSATIGVMSLCAGGLQPWTAFRPLWWTGGSATLYATNVADTIRAKVLKKIKEEIDAEG